MKILNVERIFSMAERSYLIDGAEEFVYVVRENTSISHFYEELEKELKNWPHFKITKYKKVKEGYVYVSRAHEILLKTSDLLLHRPHLKEIRKSFSEAKKMSSSFSVDDFIRKNFGLCSKKHYLLVDCIEIYNFLCINRSEVAGLLSRQIPHTQSTKIIGTEALLLKLFAFGQALEECTWKDFFLYFDLLTRSSEFRLYAPYCTWKEVPLVGLHGLVSDDIVHNYNFSGLKNTLIIENLESLLPLIVSNVETLLIWGAGWRCLQLSSLISKLPRPIFYWGDIDKEGIEIASQFCQEIEAIPINMDLETMIRFKHLSQKVVYSTPLKKMSLLQNVYSEVCGKQIRIEQEKIPFDWSIISKSNMSSI